MRHRGGRRTDVVPARRVGPTVRFAGEIDGTACLLQRAHRLLQGLGEAASDGHGLADALHVRGARPIGMRELLEREARNLDHDVVERRLEAGRRLGGDRRSGSRRACIPAPASRRSSRSGTRSPCWPAPTTANPWVHLDDDHPAGRRIHGELDVAATRVDTDRLDDHDRQVAHPLVLPIGEGHRGCHRHRVAGVHAHRVEVLDRADHDDVVGVVALHLELVLLPTQDGLLQEHLGCRRRGQAETRHLPQVVLVEGHARASTAHGEGGTDDGRSPGRRRRPGTPRVSGRRPTWPPRRRPVPPPA